MFKLRFLSLFLFIGLFFSEQIDAKEYTLQTVPNVRLTDRNNYVSNPDGIISPADARAINIALRSLEDSLGIEVAVVALESIGDNDARMFATELFRHWGIGKADDNGLLVQLITDPSQRSVVFETGYGLEGVLPDAICYRLQQQYMIPDMRDGNFSGGMLNGILAVKEYLLASDYERSEMVGSTSSDGEGDFWIFLALIFGAPVLILLIAVAVYSTKYRKRRCPRCGQKTLVYVGRETLRKPTYQAAGMAVDKYRCTNCGYTENKNHPIDRLHRSAGPIVIGGGGFGSGRSGGGFSGGGSFGGGRSGGGGSISRF